MLFRGIIGVPDIVGKVKTAKGAHLPIELFFDLGILASADKRNKVESSLFEALRSAVRGDTEHFESLAAFPYWSRSGYLRGLAAWENLIRRSTSHPCY